MHTSSRDLQGLPRTARELVMLMRRGDATTPAVELAADLHYSPAMAVLGRQPSEPLEEADISSITDTLVSRVSQRYKLLAFAYRSWFSMIYNQNLYVATCDTALYVAGQKLARGLDSVDKEFIINVTVNARVSRAGDQYVFVPRSQSALRALVLIGKRLLQDKTKPCPIKTSDDIKTLIAKDGQLLRFINPQGALVYDKALARNTRMFLDLVVGELFSSNASSFLEDENVSQDQ